MSAFAMNNTRQQRGTILVISLIMLLLMTIIGLASMRGTVLEERMAGNWRDRNIAFQAAELALRDAEDWLAPQAAPPVRYTYDSACPKPCTFAIGAVDSVADVLGADLARWQANASTYDAVSNYTLTDPLQWQTAPANLIEFRSRVRDHLGTGFGQAEDTGRDQYRITARGTGQTNEAEAVVQSHYFKRFN